MDSAAMQKLKLLGAAVIVFLIADPAMAEHTVRHCQHHQLGNPYTPEQDYMAWSAWRAPGATGRKLLSPVFGCAIHTGIPRTFDRGELGPGAKAG